MFRFTIYFTESGTTAKSQLALSRSNAFFRETTEWVKTEDLFYVSDESMSYLSFV